MLCDGSNISLNARCTLSLLLVVTYHNADSGANLVLCGPLIACYGDSSCDCGWNAKHSFAWMQMLQVRSLLPHDIADTSLSKAIVRIEGMESRKS